MATISVLPNAPGTSNGGYRAVAGHEQSTGSTVGQALDALTAQIGSPNETTLVVVQPQTADDYFPEPLRNRLSALMDRWRAANSGQALSSAEQTELDTLTQAELRASGERAAALLRQIAP